MIYFTPQAGTTLLHGYSERWKHAKEHPNSWAIDIHGGDFDDLPMLIIIIDGKEVTHFTLHAFPEDSWEWLGEILFRDFSELNSRVKQETTDAIYKNIHQALQLDRLLHKIRP